MVWSLLLWIALASVLVSHTSAQQRQDLLVWSSEFDTSDGTDALDEKTWSYDTGGGGWGNGELQTYSADNVKLQSGNLVLSVTESSVNDSSPSRSFTSGRIRTQGKLQFQYGRLEARMKFPNPANGLWPSLWMLGSDIDEVGWPQSGSVTVAQLGSAQALADGVGTSRVGSALHWQALDGQAAYYSNHFDASSSDDLTTDFFLYSMEWTPTAIVTRVNDEVILDMDITCAACDQFHKAYFLLLSVAVGGSYMNISDEAGITAPLPADLVVDYIRIYDNGFTTMSGTNALATTTEPPPVVTTTSSPTESPTTMGPTGSPTTAVPSSPTIENTTSEPTAMPVATTTTDAPISTTTDSPTLSPTDGGLPVSKEPPPAPTTTATDTTTNTSNLPVQTARAEGIQMTLNDVQPLDADSQVVWTDVTETHLENEILASIGAENVAVQITWVSQSPPYDPNARQRRRLALQNRKDAKSDNGRTLQSEHKQGIVFDAEYAIQSETEITDINRYIEGAFLSNYKKALYLSYLMEADANGFGNSTYVSIQPATNVVSSDGDGTDGGSVNGATAGSAANPKTRAADNVGLIVGIACAALVVVVLSLALFVRRRRQRNAGAAGSRQRASYKQKRRSSAAARGARPPMSFISAERKESALEHSGTIDEESLYTSHPKHKVAPNSSAHTLGVASSQYSRDGESDYSGLSSSLSNLEVDYNYREAYKNVSKSVLSGVTPGTGDEERGDDGLTVVDEFTVEAPKGKLGLILETSEEGCPVVQAVKPTSPLNGQVQVGDRLHSVDGRDVTMVMSETVSRVIASKQNRDRRTFVFARPQK